MSVGNRRSDGAIIAASRRDPERFGLIFDRHFEPIHAYLRRRVGPDAADDLAAETFVTAFRARASYDVSRDDARPWLFGIAANVVLHHRRSEHRQLLAYARLDTPVMDADVDADAAASISEITRLLASLSQADREVLLLHAWADLAYAEIAEALGVPIGTVRSRLSRARGRLRELIAPARETGGRSVPAEGARDGRA
jgi:RNA polymerase sigma-70 factor (ECF subfamily)